MANTKKEATVSIINKAARLITFSWDSKKYRLMPAGKAVDVPEGAMKSAFLKALIEDGSVKKLSKEDAKESELEALRVQATDLGIEVNDKWDAKKLTAEINKKES